MPNPVRKFRASDRRRLTSRQKALASRLKRKGLPKMVYRRAGSRSGISMANPFSDLKRVATTNPKVGSVRRYPHVYDLPSQVFAKKNKDQRRLASRRIKRGLAKRGRKPGHVLPSLRKLLAP